MFRATADTAVASVGATIAPSTNATGHDSPSACPTAATPAAVTSTNTTDKSRMARRFARISRSEVLSASQYSNAGRKIDSTTCGGSNTPSSPGTKPNAAPTTSNSTGGATCQRRARAVHSSTTTPMTTEISSPCMPSNLATRGDPVTTRAASAASAQCNSPVRNCARPNPKDQSSSSLPDTETTRSAGSRPQSRSSRSASSA